MYTLEFSTYCKNESLKYIKYTQLQTFVVKYSQQQVNLSIKPSCVRVCVYTCICVCMYPLYIGR